MKLLISDQQIEIIQTGAMILFQFAPLLGYFIFFAFTRSNIFAFNSPVANGVQIFQRGRCRKKGQLCAAVFCRKRWTLVVQRQGQVIAVARLLKFNRYFYPRLSRALSRRTDIKSNSISTDIPRMVSGEPVAVAESECTPSQLFSRRSGRNAPCGGLAWIA